MPSIRNPRLRSLVAGSLMFAILASGLLTLSVLDRKSLI